MMNSRWLGWSLLVAGLTTACAAKVSKSATGGYTDAASTGSSAGGGIAASSGAGAATASSNDSASGTGGTVDVASTGAGATSGAGGATCKTPSTLHPPKPGATKTIYCPFSAMNGGKNVYCTKQTQHCCEPKVGTSTCEAVAKSCAATDTDWVCEDPSDCGKGQLCCSNDGAALTVNSDPNCANYATGFKGTHCAASCLATEITLCTADAACGAKKCTPFDTKGNQVGGCH